MSNPRKLIALGMVPELAKEVAAQADGAAGEAIASITAITTADATDATTAAALANACKAKINALIAALKA